MSNLQSDTQQTSTAIGPDPFADPVGYLARLGIEAVLIEHIALPDAA